MSEYRETRAYLRQEGFKHKSFWGLDDSTYRFLTVSFIEETPAGGDLLDLFDFEKLKIAALKCYGVEGVSETAIDLSSALNTRILKNLSEMFIEEYPSDEERSERNREEFELDAYEARMAA